MKEDTRTVMNAADFEACNCFRNRKYVDEETRQFIMCFLRRKTVGWNLACFLESYPVSV